MLHRDQWMSEFAGWVESFAWLWFCNLTYRPFLSETQRRRLFRRWIEELRGALGTEDFSWIAVPEDGRTGADFHFHALIGGLSAWHARQRVVWMRKWNCLAGDALITIYNPSNRGARYILKTVTPQNVEKVEFEISSRNQLQTNFGAK